MREIRELNVGAYVDAGSPRSSALLPARRRIPPHRLRSSLIRSGLRVESYQLYDQDEVQGINTAQDSEQAEFILKSGSIRPRREEEQNLVTFGTGGWRAIIGEGFTMHNVRRLSQALANEITRRSARSQRRHHRLRPALPLETGRRSVRRGLRRQ